MRLMFIMRLNEQVKIRGDFPTDESGGVVTPVLHLPREPPHTSGLCSHFENHSYNCRKKMQVTIDKQERES